MAAKKKATKSKKVTRKKVEEPQVSDKRYVGKYSRMPSGEGNWWFTKHASGVDFDKHKENEDHFKIFGKYPAAVKKAQAWAKEKGYKTVHVCEESESMTDKELNEISKELAGRYTKAAPYSMLAAARRNQELDARNKDSSGETSPSRYWSSKEDRKESQKNSRQWMNRRRGINKAVDKLTGKARVNATEETELTEVSKKLLNRYIDKGGKSYQKLSAKSDEYEDRAMEIDGSKNEYNAKRQQKWVDKASALTRPMRNRLKGYDLARAKLSGKGKVNATEETEMSEKELNELHGKGDLSKIRSYHQKKYEKTIAKAHKTYKKTPHRSEDGDEWDDENLKPGHDLTYDAMMHKANVKRSDALSKRDLKKSQTIRNTNPMIHVESATLIDAALNNKPLEFQDALENAVLDKVRDLIDQKRDEIAYTLLSPVNDVFEGEDPGIFAEEYGALYEDILAALKKKYERAKRKDPNAAKHLRRRILDLQYGRRKSAVKESFEFFTEEEQDALVELYGKGSLEKIGYYHKRD